MEKWRGAGKNKGRKGKEEVKKAIYITSRCIFPSPVEDNIVVLSHHVRYALQKSKK